MAQVSEQDYELLSAYVDGMLTEDERLALERRLHSDADLLRELTALYLTLAMVKQLPTLTAPRNFTLPEAPTRWLVFPTTTTFSALSAAAATFLVAVGFLMLLTTMNAAAPQPASDQEVALISNTISSTGNAAGTTPQEGQAQVLATAVAPPTLSIGAFSTTATAAAIIAPTLEENLFAATAQTGAGGGIVPAQAITTTPAPAAAEVTEESPQESAADSIDIAMMPLSTGTPAPTGTPASAFIAPQGTSVPSEEITDDTDGAAASEDETGSRLFESSEQPVTNTENQQGNTAAAQVPSATPLPTQMATVTMPPTETASPAAPPSTSSRAMPAALGAGLVLAGAVLFGIAFMTAVTRRSEKRRTKREG
jgi:hypothetical protein